MLKILSNWLSDSPTEQQDSMTIELAAAALMVEVMAADDEWHRQEEQTLVELLVNSLQLDSDAAKSLIQAAKEHHSEANDLYKITKKINDQYSAEQKYELVLDLWRIAYADGNLDRYEDHMVRKIAELIYLPHSEFIRAKLTASPEQQKS